MAGTDTRADWIERFEGLNRLPPDLRADLARGSKVISVPAGTEVFAPGQSADNLLLLLEGTVRVQQRSETGREVFLYRVHAGESCVLTTACMLAFEDYSADGVAETDVTAVAIPRATFDDLAARSPVFREFIFKAYSRRITDLFTLIDDIVFQRMDVRLASRLLELADENDVVHATHQVLGTELGTAREVISRTLAEFHRRGWVEQSRGEVRIVGRAGLERLVRSAGER
ncbi:cyclic nucleotide-binding domain-containing protein [Rhodobacterales bacterium HKCCE2091]|nr:cyclic nucleotide-binding domain-containing protein [Rhodobacterales bacterium HKCCE2091]